MALACARESSPFDLPAPPDSLPPLPAGWPETLQLGLTNDLGGANDLRSKAPLGMRYQYLAGGVNTDENWQSWVPVGRFLHDYVAESSAAGLLPVFTYYNLRQSLPGANDDNEARADYANLQDASTMRSYWLDLERFFIEAGATGSPLVLHVEPDLWGYMEQRSRNNDASTVRALVGGSGVGALSGLPDTMTGFAAALIRLRDTHATNVLLVYHLSLWGTGTSIDTTNPDADELARLAERAAAYYESLGADFDLVFSEFSDRDAAFHQIVNKQRDVWWDESDYARVATFFSRFVQATGKRIVVWQIPLGNTLMRAQDNTPGHYQDNRVEMLLDGTPDVLRAYRDAGVIAFLFGGGAPGTTCACDDAEDGVTNPAPIGGNRRLSLSADDDGGYFFERAAAYYRSGPLPLTTDSASGR